MSNSDRPDTTGERLTPEERRRVVRAAFLRPMSLLVVVIGAVFFALTLAWWALPLTLVTYAALVLLAARDPLFRDYVLLGGEARSGRISPRASSERDVPPERRARWLPRGETRRKVEEALELHRRTMIAIEESGDVAQAVLGDVVPKLQGVTGRLVDLAERREKVAGAIRDLRNHPGAPQREGRNTDLDNLENELCTADAEITQSIEKLSTLRARVVRISVESGGAAQEAAASLNVDLDEMNLRLDALCSTMSPSEPLDR
jgi:hypothetical protein